MSHVHGWRADRQNPAPRPCESTRLNHSFIVALHQELKSFPANAWTSVVVESLQRDFHGIWIFGSLLRVEEVTVLREGPRRQHAQQLVVQLLPLGLLPRLLRNSIFLPPGGGRASCSLDTACSAVSSGGAAPREASVGMGSAAVW